MNYSWRWLQGIVIAGSLILSVAASATMIRNPSLHPSGKMPAQKRDLNERMVRFCKYRVGKKVGTGQCADLTAQALLAIGAAAQFKDFPADGDYVWGTLVRKMEVKHGKKSGDNRRQANLKPGDIIQFRDAVFQGRSGNFIYRKMCPHHTAVIERVSPDGSNCKVWEQNTSGKLYVIESDLHLSDLSAGWVRIYRPMEKTPLTIYLKIQKVVPLSRHNLRNQSSAQANFRTAI